MRRYVLVSILLLVFLTLGGCSEDRGLNPQSPADPGTPSMTVDPELVAKEIVAKIGWPAELEDGEPLDVLAMGSGGCVIEIDRQPIVGDVVHYSFQITVGPGPYDVIGLHRVVREKRPCRPIKTKKNLFMAHGDGANFMAAFLTSVLSPTTPDEHAMPVYLAQNDVDVWGIDFGWTFVPLGTTDFSFFAGWGLEKEASHLELALAIARATRALTGGGFGKMHLLAWSSGANAGYVYLNNETQKPEFCRHVKGFIPVDAYMKTDDEEVRLSNCADAADRQAMIDAGMYQDETGVLAQTLYILAMTAPNDPSPVIPGLTNYQTALFMGAATWNLATPTPYYHLCAGVFNEYGIPVDLQYTPAQLWLDFIGAWSPYAPHQRQVDMGLSVCDEVDVPFDDHLGEITVPVMYVGAGGGFGEYGVYTTTLLGSTDVTELVVDLAPPEARFLDFGHVDLFQADNAPSLVWEPVLTWIEEHTSGRGYGKAKPKH